MKIGKWFAASMTLTLALATAGAVTAFAMTSDGGSDIPRVPSAEDTAGEFLHGDPTYDQWISDFGDGTVVTSIDDIDPNVCNFIHNINACTPEELQELGNLAAISWIVDSETEVESEPEPPFVDGEPMYEVQSREEAVEQDCGLAGGTLHVNFDGEIWCVFVHDLEDGGEVETQAQPPVVLPEPEPLPGN